MTLNAQIVFDEITFNALAFPLPEKITANLKMLALQMTTMRQLFESEKGKAKAQAKVDYENAIRLFETYENQLRTAMGKRISRKIFVSQAQPFTKKGSNHATASN
jgi:hypothetical protein